MAVYVQSVESIRKLKAFRSERPARFIPTASHVMLPAHGNSIAATLSERRSARKAGMQPTALKTSKILGRSGIFEYMAFHMNVSLKCLLNKILGAVSAQRKSVRKPWLLTIAMVAGLSGESSAISAISHSLPSSAPASFTQPYRISKGIEAGHKQARDNTARTGYDKLQITPKELLGSAVFPWSRVVSMFSLSGTELLYTSGEEEIVDLMEFYLDAAEKGVKEAWEVGIVGDGTADGGRQMIGLGAAIPIIANTGVYGGIDRGTIPNWRTTTYNIASGDVAGYTTWDSTTVRPIINRIVQARSRNNRYAKMLIADPLAYEAFDASLVAHQRVVNENRVGRLGFSAIEYVTPAGPVEVYSAGGIGNVMPANTVYGIDTEGLAIYTFPGQEFVPFHPGNGLRPINQDAVAQGIVWSGQLVLENPIFSFRIRTTS